jgi:hypothetical protein
VRHSGRGVASSVVSGSIEEACWWRAGAGRQDGERSVPPLAPEGALDPDALRPVRQQSSTGPDVSQDGGEHPGSARLRECLLSCWRGAATGVPLTASTGDSCSDRLGGQQLR